MGMGVASWCFEWAVCAGGDVGEPLMFHFGFQAAYAYLLPAQAFRRLPRAGASPCTPRENCFQAAFIAPAFRQPEISVKLKTNGVLAACQYCSNQ